MRWRAVVIGVLFASGGVARDLSATQFLHADLPEIVDRSQWAFQGRCTDRHVDVFSVDQFPKGILVTVYTFHVDHWIKGQEGNDSTFRFAEWGAKTDECRQRGFSCPIGGVQYEVNRDYILFLIAPSSLHLPVPLTSPVAFEDGAFQIIDAPDGTKSVKNRSSLTKTFSLGKEKGGVQKSEIPISDFLRMVGELQRP